MKSSQNLFDRLKSIQVPELRIFENLVMTTELEKLTVQLKSANGQIVSGHPLEAEASHGAGKRRLQSRFFYQE